MANAEKAFPSRAGYKQWIRRLKRLLGQVGRLVRAAALRGLAGEGRKLYAADSLPIPLCESARHGRVRLLAEDGAKFGVEASGDWFYGFKIHVLIHRPTQMVPAAMLLRNSDSSRPKRPGRRPRVGTMGERRRPPGRRGLSGQRSLRLAL